MLARKIPNVLPQFPGNQFSLVDPYRYEERAERPARRLRSNIPEKVHGSTHFVSGVPKVIHERREAASQSDVPNLAVRESWVYFSRGVHYRA